MPVEHPIESWREVPGFPGYRVSDHGRVQSCKGRGNRRPGPIWRDMQPVLLRIGYYQVNFRLGDGVLHRRYVHRLVLEVFVGPCPEGMERCHCDGTRTNNHLSNLRWGTHASNMQDAARHGVMGRTSLPGEQHPMAKLTADQVQEIRRLRKAGCNASALAARFRVTPTQVYRVANSECWGHLANEQEAAS